jgi:hypothetical protein
MMYISLAIIIVVITVLFLVLKKNNKELFSDTPQCVAGNDECTEYYLLVSTITNYLDEIVFNLLFHNDDLKNHLKAIYSKASDDKKITILKNKIKEFIDLNNDKIDIKTNHIVPNTFYEFDIHNSLSEEYNGYLSDDQIKEKNKLLKKIGENDEIKSNLIKFNLINCCLECMRSDLIKIVNANIPELSNDLDENILIIITYLITTNPDFSGNYILSPIEVDTDSKLNSFKEIIKTRGKMLNNITGTL